MIDLFYQLLEKIGYEHPIHPPLTHIPMGLIIGVFLFALVAVVFRRTLLPSVAYRRILLLALISAIPTILFGYMDWQHFYDGAWLFPIIMKMILSGLLLIFLVLALLLGPRDEKESKKGLTLYTICLLIITGLGYFGGQLIFEGEGRPENVPIRFLAGERLFAKNCSECHPHGGNILSSPRLTSVDTFLSFIRDPKGPNGSSIGMPPFPPEKISDQDGLKLYRYILQLSRQKKK
jgi:uncharacterized membrane protein